MLNMLTLLKKMTHVVTSILITSATNPHPPLNSAEYGASGWLYEVDNDSCICIPNFNLTIRSYELKMDGSSQLMIPSVTLFIL